eukprot:jgi/Tetstr1/444226/TSEL_032119.t1
MAPAGSRTAKLRAAIGRQRAAAAHCGEFLLATVSLAICAEAGAAFPGCDACSGLAGVCFRADNLRAVAGLEELSATALQAAVFFDMAGLQGDWDPASVSLDEVSPPRRQLSELFVHVNAQDDNIWCPFVLAKDGVKDGVSNIWRNISPGEPKAAYAQLESAVVPLCAQSTNPKALCDWMREMVR